MSNENQITLRERIVGFKDSFQKVSVLKDHDFMREAEFAYQALTNRTKKQIQEGKENFLLITARQNPSSLKNAITNVAAIGITLNPALKLAYLVPRDGNVCLDVSYMGLIKLATDTGAVEWAKAEIVFENDTFQLNDIDKAPTHTRNPFKERGKMLGVYCVAKVGDSYLTETMTIEEVYKIRDLSDGWKNEKARYYSPWLHFEESMIKKTVVKRAYKFWPKTDKNNRLENAIHIINEHEGIDFNSAYERKNAELEEDFPIPENEKVIGSPEFRVQNAKFRGMQLKDIDPDEMRDYVLALEKRWENNNPKPWEKVVHESMVEYILSIEAIEINGEQSVL